ncbi:hypothetical protein ABIA32_006041 [Streptacidiphilus sp. MAP12-20]|uniref:hypothetical protein n=1 Tax=Streptacidiphilus sp. MAP12-20 TaxID=3156299 RepID=UPI003514E5CC
MSTEITQLVSDLVGRMSSGSAAAFQEGLAQLAEAARAGGPETLTAAVGALAPILTGLGGDFTKAAVLAGACVEWGGSPLALVGVLPLPKPSRKNTERLEQVFAPLVRPGGALTAGHLKRIAMSWYDMDDWLKGLLTALAHGEFRDALPPATKADQPVCEEDVQLGVVADATHRQGVAAAGLGGEDQQLLVVEHGGQVGHPLGSLRPSGDGCGPAAGLLPARRPDPSWVAAATDADPHLGPDNPAIRAFRLFGGHGAYVFPEGRPADIELLHGVRVLLVHPPHGDYGMSSGRVFTAMRPTLALDRQLDPSEAEDWLARATPAIEDDLMAPLTPPR